MARLGDILTSIEALCDTMSKLEFDPPGIFTNAIINKPDVTSLIRDPSEAELSLYKISKGTGLGSLMLRRKDEQSKSDRLVDLKPQRIDGKRVFEEVDGGTSGAVVQVPRLVKVPDDDKKANIEAMSSPTKKRFMSQYKLISADVLESDDFELVFTTANDVIVKYPNIVNDSDIKETLNSIRQEYDQLLEETQALEKAVQRQKDELGAQGDNIYELESPGRDVDELIRIEEGLIEGLERELEAAKS